MQVHGHYLPTTAVGHKSSHVRWSARVSRAYTKRGILLSQRSERYGRGRNARVIGYLTWQTLSLP